MPPAEILYAENLALKSENGALQGEVLDLKRQLEWLRRQVFGPGVSAPVSWTQGKG